MIVDHFSTVNKSARNAMSVALILIGAIAMYNWIVSPHVGYLHAVQRYRPVIKEVAHEKSAIVKDLDAKGHELHALREELVELRGTFFTASEAKDFLSGLQLLVDEAGCTVNSAVFTVEDERATLGEEAEPSSVVSHCAALAVLGQYEQIGALLERLQGGRKKVWIDSCHMETFDLDTGQLKCDFVLTICAVCDREDPTDE